MTPALAVSGTNGARIRSKLAVAITKGRRTMRVVRHRGSGIIDRRRFPNRHWFVVAFTVSIGVYGETAVMHEVPLFPPAAVPDRQGFVRIINHADRAGEVRLHVIDDAGSRWQPIDLGIEGKATLHLNSDDIENGNDEKGIASGTGPGNGDWRIAVESDLDIEVLAYIRTANGFLTSMHETVAREEDGSYRVAFFNPGDNDNQRSSLRLINPGDDGAAVTITGIDDQGMTPGEDVVVEIPAGASRTLSSRELETGGTGFDGSLGDGAGKWRLSIQSDRPITVVGLLASPTGEISNTSAAPIVADETGSHVVPLFPAASDPADRQGFVRVINHAAVSGAISVDSDEAHDPVTLPIGASEALHFNSDDWEFGNSAKGLSGVGGTDNDWRLSLSSDLDIDVLAYIRNTRDGFVSPMYADVPAAGYRHRLAVFNPGSNTAQVSQLRLANPGLGAALVTITGVDDNGESPGDGVTLSLAGGRTRILDAAELEAGGLDFDGALGDGAGKWQLVVESDAPIGVMNLMASPTGHLTNLSGVSAQTAPTEGSAFSDRAAGRRLVLDDGNRHIDFLAERRYRETRARETTTGSYAYSNTGTTTATLSLTTDDGVSCMADIAFESRISGRLSGCEDGEADLDWRLLDPARRDGDSITYEITAMIAPLQSDPEVVRGATVTVSDGVRIAFENGGYVESGAHRFTCRDVAGCVIDNQVVKRGRVVQTPALGERDFPFDEANGSPTGLAYGSGHFYVVDADDLKVYAYNDAGVRAAALDFDLAAANRTPAGITLGPDRFYVVDEDDFLDEDATRTVFVYDTDGQHMAAETIEVSATIREPLGIAYLNDTLFLADAWTKKVYAYRASGERDPDADFDLVPDNASPRGIAYGNGRFFVVDVFDDKVYAYRIDGSRDRDADFNLADGNSLARGIAYVDARFFVANPGWAFAYPSDRPDLIIDAFAVTEERPDAGRAFNVDVTVRNIGHRRANETTLRYYLSVDTTIPRNDDEVGQVSLDRIAAGGIHQQTHELTAPTMAGFYNYGVCIDALPDEYDQGNCSDTLEITVPVDVAGATVGFALDAANRNPIDITYRNGRFFVLDSGDDHVYAYRASAARDADSDIALHPDNRRPVAIAYANGAFYVPDLGDDKVYAYNSSGERNADVEFALDPDNQSPYGIAFADGRFYIADASDRKVYAYAVSGEREAVGDFDLFRGNDTTRGMAFAENRLFVVDLIDAHVYAYSTTGERDTAVEFGLVGDNRSPAGIASAQGRLYVADSTDDTVYGYAIPRVADLTVDTAAVSNAYPDAGASFTFTATVRNLGDGRSHGAAVRYYLASDGEYETSDNLAGTGSVGGLDPDAAQDVSFPMTAPTDDGCYYCGACVDVVRGERVRSNNCAEPAEILLGDGPDMDVSRIQIHTAGVGGPVEAQIGVINRGTGRSQEGELRFTGGDDVVIDIPALDPGEEEIFPRQRIGTGQAGTTTFEICIDVPCEVNPEDDCRTRSITL